jgi:hypothetical protein
MPYLLSHWGTFIRTAESGEYARFLGPQEGKVARLSGCSGYRSSRRTDAQPHIIVYGGALSSVE